MHIATAKQQQVLCCLHGRAGTGKAYVIKALYQGIYRLLCISAGENQDISKILTVAPIGKAAYNVTGSTTHAAFNIPANQKLQYTP